MAQAGMMDPKEVSRQNVKLALQIFLRTILAAVLSFFLYFSITAIVNGLSTHAIGYRIYEYDENSQPVLVEEGSLDEESSVEPSSETPSTEDGETATTETTKRQYRETVRSEVPPGAADFSGRAVPDPDASAAGGLPVWDSLEPGGSGPEQRAVRAYAGGQMERPQSRTDCRDPLGAAVSFPASQPSRTVLE